MTLPLSFDDSMHFFPSFYDMEDAFNDSKYTLLDDRDESNPAILDLVTTRETQKVFSKSIKRKSPENNTDYLSSNTFQALTKKSCTRLLTSTDKETPKEKTISPRNLKDLSFGLKSSSETTILVVYPESKKNLTANIKYLSHATTGTSLEEIQTSYANEFKVALQDIKDICFAVSSNCPTANETSEIKQIGPNQS